MFDLLILLICFLFNDTWTEPFFELNNLHLNVAMMDDGMDSDDDLLLTIEVVFRRKSLLPNFSNGSLVDGILNSYDCGEQNSERNVVDQ